MERNNIEDLFGESLEKKLKLVEEYEEKQSYESAYLIKWQIIEKIIKLVAKVTRKENLRKNLHSWIDYLEDRKKEKPKDINNFNVDSDKIPPIELVETFFDKPLEKTKEVINPKAKYRIKRNQIAHSFSEKRFNKEQKYKEYSQKLDEAIDELRDAYENMKATKNISN